jgi:hypothetical protein
MGVFVSLFARFQRWNRHEQSGYGSWLILISSMGDAIAKLTEFDENPTTVG